MVRLPHALLSAGLALAACESPPPVDRAPRPLTTPLVPETVLALAAVDAVLEGTEAYELAEVEYRGMTPKAVVLERYRRGDCFFRQHYAPRDDGEILPVRLEVAAAEAGTAPKAGTVRLLVARAALEAEGTVGQRDPLGRVAWIHAREGTAVERITQVRYEVDSCVLPARLDRYEVPPRERPAAPAKETTD